jgi:hypothetical protein
MRILAAVRRAAAAMAAAPAQRAGADGRVTEAVR